MANRMRTYLSIDLDFWNKSREYNHLRWFLRQAIDVTRNVMIVDSHEKLLKHINHSDCDTLFNVDYHSDIINRFDPHEPEHKNVLNCGTWVNFVNFRNRGSFTWIAPYPLHMAYGRGYCHQPHVPRSNPFKNPKVAGWLVTHQKFMAHPEKEIDWWSVGGVGIAFSYDWLDDKKDDRIVEEARRILKTVPKVGG